MSDADHANVTGAIADPAERCVARTATPADWPRIWPRIRDVPRPILREGRGLPLPMDWSEDRARAFWFAGGNACVVGERDGRLVWTYYVAPIFHAGASHIANAACLVNREFAGQGGGGEMVRHSIRYARDAGYLAMEYKIVLANNEATVRLYTSAGFAIVGRVPDGYRHPHADFVDTLIMHRKL